MKWAPSPSIAAAEHVHAEHLMLPSGRASAKSHQCDDGSALKRVGAHLEVRQRRQLRSCKNLASSSWRTAAGKGSCRYQCEPSGTYMPVMRASSKSRTRLFHSQTVSVSMRKRGWSGVFNFIGDGEACGGRGRKRGAELPKSHEWQHVYIRMYGNICMYIVNHILYICI